MTYAQTVITALDKYLTEFYGGEVERYMTSVAFICHTAFLELRKKKKNTNPVTMKASSNLRGQQMS